MRLILRDIDCEVVYYKAGFSAERFHKRRSRALKTLIRVAMKGALQSIHMSYAHAGAGTYVFYSRDPNTGYISKGVYADPSDLKSVCWQDIEAVMHWQDFCKKRADEAKKNVKPFTEIVAEEVAKAKFPRIVKSELPIEFYYKLSYVAKHDGYVKAMGMYRTYQAGLHGLSGTHQSAEGSKRQLRALGFMVA